MPRNRKRFNSILLMQIFSMIRCQSLHNKTFWLVNNEEKHLKETNLLGNMWFKHCSLRPVTSCQSSQGHIKGVLCLVSQDDVHHGKVLGSQGTAVPQQWQWVSGCRVCGAAAACPWGDTVPELLGVLGSFTPRLSWATRVTYRTVWWKQNSWFQSFRPGVASAELTSYALFEPITEELAQVGSRQI